MPARVDFKFTDEQLKAIGELVADNWEAHFQTSFETSSFGVFPVLWAQQGPNLPVKSWKIHPDGTVVRRGDYRSTDQHGQHSFRV